jgi:hypothetical protein
MKTAFLFLNLFSFVFLLRADSYLLNVYPGLAIAHQTEDRLSLKIFAGQMIYVTDGDNRAVIDFTEFGDYKAFYRFKAKGTGSSEVTDGIGEVYEKYIRRSRPDGEVDLVNAGSRLFIQAGSIQIEWSYCSGSSGFIYFNPKKINVSVLNNKFYDLVAFPSPGPFN